MRTRRDHFSFFATIAMQSEDATHLSKGGFYHHFASKSEVLDALLRRYTRWFLDTVEAKVAGVPANEMEKRFQTWICAYAEAYLATFSVHDLVYHSMHTSRANEDRLAVIGSIERLLQKKVSSKARGFFLHPVLLLRLSIRVTDDAIASQTEDILVLAKKLSTSLRLLLQ